MTEKILLPLWLIFLAVFNGLPTIGYTHSRSNSFPASSPNIADPLTSHPTSSLDDRPQSWSPNPLSEPSSKPSLSFDRITAAEGLSFSLALSILQDEQGFMWFGTRYGLNKYDGYNFTIYDLTLLSLDPFSGNGIRFLYQDRSGDLWIGTYLDLVRLDSETGTFIHYRYGAAVSQSTGEWPVYAIGEDSTGTLWVGTYNGLYRYEPATDTFSVFLKKQLVRKIYRDRQGGLWIGTTSGLWHSEPGSQGPEGPVFDRYPFDQVYVTAIQEDQQGALWVGTGDDGIRRVDLSTGMITRYKHDPQDPHSLSNSYISSLLVDAAGRLWVGTSDGLNLYDPSTEGFFHYKNDPDDLHSLSSDLVFDLYQDRSGVIWIATLAGINKLNETASRFTHYRQLVDPTDAGGQQFLPGLSDSMAEVVFVDRHENLWVGTVTGGLNRLDAESGKTTIYRHDPADPSSLSGDEVATIYEDRAGILWFGSNGGLDRFDPQTETFEAVGVLRNHVVSTIAEDQQGNLWVGYAGGILRNEGGGSTNPFTSPKPIGDILYATRVNNIYPDQTGAIWFSTEDTGLYRLDPPAEAGSEPTVVHVSQEVDNSHNPGISSVTSFYEDSQGTLWIGTLQDGLLRYDRQTQSFTQFLPNLSAVQYVGCVQEDAQGYLWMGTKLGLARFDPLSETFLYFDARDGLQVGETLTCAQDRQGRMYFGGLQGLSVFSPSELRDNSIPPPVVITALNVRNQALRTDLPADEQVELSYQENYLSFDFAALDYTAPAKNQYAYKMEGLDADWIEAGERRHADYPDLKPGTYTFRVKASNNSGIWNEQGAVVHLTITPPFWQTWWFRGLFAAMIIIAVLGAYRLRVRSIEARNLALEEQVSDRTKETEHRRQEMEALYQADEELYRHIHLDEILQALVDIAVGILHADKGTLLVWDDGKDYLVARASHGFDPALQSRIRIKAGEGIAGKVAVSGKPYIVEDTLTNPDVSRTITDPEDIRSFMQVPIQIKGETFGVFSADYLQPRTFKAEEQRLLIAFAQRAALAIQNAQAFEQEQELAVLEERSRLARELHDAVTQTLFSASLVAEALPAIWDNDPKEGRGLLQELRSLSRGALAEMRTLLLELRPTALLETSLADLLRQLGEAASGKEGIPVIVQVNGLVAGTMPSLPSDVHIAFYRIAQEALNNVIKHAKAHQAGVRLSYRIEDRSDTLPGINGELPVPAGLSVLLSICDDGRGFDPTHLPHDRLGLGIMQERAQAVGALLTIESQPGQGTQVTVQWKQEKIQEAK